MPPIFDRYTAPARAKVAGRPIHRGESEAIERFIEHTDHLLAAILAGLILCAGFIVFA